MSHKVSVIIPTFRRALPFRAIDSVLNQTYENIEVIVVDDNGNGSIPTQTQQLMERLYGENPKVVYIKTIQI